MDWLHVLNGHLAKCAENGLLRQFEALTNNFARAEFILGHEKLLGLDRYLSSHVSDGGCEGKSSKRSDEARANGNAFFSQRTENQKAFAYYTRALMSAPVAAGGSWKENKALVLAYSNRSAVLYEEGLFKECLADIDQCTAYLSRKIDMDGQVEWLFNLVFKLANRQKNCYHKMQRIEPLSSFEACQLFQILKSDVFCEEKYAKRREELMGELGRQLADLLAIKVKKAATSKDEDIGKVGYLAKGCLTVEFTKEKGSLNVIWTLGF
jgi:hypothetical protein